MKWLLDTHVLVWLVEGTSDLLPRTRKQIAAAGAAHGFAVSAISFWEVAILAARNRLSLAVPAVEWRRRVLALPGIIEAPVTGDVAVEAVELPGELHRDPADRMLVATARLHGWRLATRDRKLLDYAADGHVHAVAI